MERLSRLVSSLLAAASICVLALAVILWPGVVVADDDPISPAIGFTCGCACGGSCGTTPPIFLGGTSYACVGTCIGPCTFLKNSCAASCGCNPTIPPGTIKVVCNCL